MKLLPEKVEGSPVLVRVVPFVVFISLTVCQDVFGASGRFWVYTAKSVVGAVLLWQIWPLVKELEWRWSWEAVLVGVAVFVMWVGLVPALEALGINPSFAELKVGGAPWNPFEQFPGQFALAWGFVVARIAGSSLVVPPLEEMFFRSFLYRYIEKSDFLSIPLGRFMLRSFLITSLVFGLEHREWLAGVLCGFAYQGLVCWKNRLGDAITAHAITNLLLGLWVVWRNAWHFW